MEGLVIRKARPSDAGGISALISGLAHYLTLDSTGKGEEQFFSSVSAKAVSRYICSPSFNYLVGSIDGCLAGVVAIREGKHLFHLFVSPEFHRRGVGRALWMHAAAEALRAGNHGLFTVNSTPYAVPVYERFGFRAVGSRTEMHGIAYVPMQLEMPGDTDRP